MPIADLESVGFGVLRYVCEDTVEQEIIIE